jgi:hypothetical protein
LVLVGQHMLDFVLLCISPTFALSSKQQVSSPYNSFFFFPFSFSFHLRQTINLTESLIYFHYCCGRTYANCISNLFSCSFLWVTVTQMSQAFHYYRAKLSISVQRVMRRVINFCFDNFLLYYLYGVVFLMSIKENVLLLI